MALRLGWDRGTLARSLLGDDALQVNCKPSLGEQLNHELRPEKTKQLLDSALTRFQMRHCEVDRVGAFAVAGRAAAVGLALACGKYRRPVPQGAAQLVLW